MPLIESVKARARRIGWLHTGYRRLRHAWERPAAHPAFSRPDLAGDSAARRLRSFLASGQRWRFPGSDSATISVVIPVFNRADLTFRCLEALAAEAVVGVEAIVIDNASSDDTAALFAAIDGVHYVRNERNLHFLEGSNQGAGLASGEFVLFLNSDTAVARGSLKAALDALRESPNAGAVGGRLVLLDGSLQEAGGIVWRDGTCLGYGRGDAPDRAPYEFRRPVDFCSGAFLLTRRALFTSLGGFDPDFRPAYYEDVDYCLRLWGQGFSVLYEPRAIVWHFEYASSTVGDASQMMRDRQSLLVRKHARYLQERPSPKPEAVLEARTAPDRDRARVLWIDERIPHAKYGAGYPRARAILLCLKDLGCAVTIYPAVFEERDECWEQIYKSVPRDIEVAALTGFGPEGLHRFLRERRDYYDWIFVSRPETMKTVRRIVASEPALMPWNRVVYDAEALFADRDRLEAVVRGTPLTDDQYRSRLESELSLSDGVSAITTVSVAEAAAFRGRGFDKVVVLSHAVAPKAARRPFRERAGILFVGAIHGDGGPNHDALMWFCERVLPILRRRGVSETFHVVGFNRMTDMSGLRLPGVEVAGEVPALDEWYERCRVFVAPTRFSAGIPLKVVEALAAGLPSVVTPLLVRQLGWEALEPPVPAGESAERFAAEVERLITDEAHWRRTSEQAVALVSDRFSAGVMQEALRSVIGDIRPCHGP